MLLSVCGVPAGSLLQEHHQDWQRVECSIETELAGDATSMQEQAASLKATRALQVEPGPELVLGTRKPRTSPKLKMTSFVFLSL